MRPPRRRHTRARAARSTLAGAALCAIGLSRMAAPAVATFTSVPSDPSMSVSAGTLSAPTGLTAQNVNCTPLIGTQVALTWTATASAWASGYEILRSLTSGGPYLSHGTVSGQSTTTWTDTSVTFSTTYYYVVQATKSSWRSPNSNQAQIATPTPLCG